MRVVVVTPPEPVVSVEEARQQCRVLHNDEDTLIEGYVAAATEHLDGPNGWLGRALGVQTLEARFSLPSCGTIFLPCPPVFDLVDVRYLGSDGVERSAHTIDFELFGDELASVGSSWPWMGGSTKREAGRIRYRAGYEKLPSPIRAAILLMVDDLYRNRGETVKGVSTAAVPMSTTVTNLLSPYRVYR